MGIEIVFLIKAIFFGLAAIIIIPRELYKKYLVYGLLLGALVDTVLHYWGNTLICLNIKIWVFSIFLICILSGHHWRGYL